MQTSSLSCLSNKEREYTSTPFIAPFARLSHMSATFSSSCLQIDNILLDFLYYDNDHNATLKTITNKRVCWEFVYLCLKSTDTNGLHFWLNDITIQKIDAGGDLGREDCTLILQQFGCRLQLVPSLHFTKPSLCIKSHHFLYENIETQ